MIKIAQKLSKFSIQREYASPEKKQNKFRILALKAVKKAMQETTVVLVDEEYGYREWLWLPNMSTAELKSWWEAQASIDGYWMNPKTLPGKLILISLNLACEITRALDHKIIRAFLHDDSDSCVKLTLMDGTRVYHQGRPSPVDNDDDDE